MSEIGVYRSRVKFSEMEEWQQLLQMSNANLVSRASSFLRMEAISNRQSPTTTNLSTPEPSSSHSNRNLSKPIATSTPKEPASELTLGEFKPYKPKKILRRYGVDMSDLMNQIRRQKRPLDHFTPRTHLPEGVPLKRYKSEEMVKFKPNPRYNNPSDSLFNDLKRRLKLEVQMVCPGSIRILQMNVRTLTDKKLPYVKELLRIHQPELLFVNEFGVDKDTPVFPRIETYYVVSYELKSTFSGVAIYAQASIVDNVQLIKTDHQMKMAQICGIQVKNMKLYNVYRSPSMEHDEEKLFCQWISSLDQSDVLIIGDLNLHVFWENFKAEPGNPGHQNIADEFMEAGFIQYQYGMTFESSGRTLDITLCNNLETVMTCTTDELFQAHAIDHIPTLTDILLDVEIVEEREIKLWKKRDKEKFAKIVERELTKLIEYFDEKEENEITVDELDSRLADLLLDAEDETVPVITFKTKRMPSGKINSMSEKTKGIYDMVRKLRKAGKLTEANKMMAVVKSSLERDRKNWSMFFVNKLNRDRNALWKEIKNSTVSNNSSGPLKRPDGTLTFDAKEKVKLLKDRYESVLTPKVEHTCDVEDLSSCRTTPGLGEMVITPGDVYGALKKCNNSAAKDSRGLSMPLFRECAEILARYLATMFNYSMDDSVLAAIWLLAMTIPIPKGGDLSLPKQWRPVVLEQTPVRIFEAVYNFKLVNYLESIGFFHYRQDGFRRGHSTIHNLLEFWQFLVKLMSTYGAVDVIYADTSAAFDRLSHGKLLDKLFHSCGVYGKPWYWVKSWTTKRRQFVFWNGESSQEFDVSSSCMQGSSLGTTLWNIYFNEVCECIETWIEELEIEGCTFFVYADDVKILYFPSASNVLKINELLRRLQAKMDELLLKFNASKCKILTLGGWKNPRYDVFMTNEDGVRERLERTTVERDLGLQVDADGSFSTQTKKCIGVAKSTAKIMSRIFKKADFVTKVQLYEAHIFSRLSYASEIWGSLNRKTLDEMNRIWIDHFKFVFVPADRYPPLLPEQAFKEKDLLMLFKIFNGMTPLKKDNYFGTQSPSVEPRTRSQHEQRIQANLSNKWEASTLVARNRDVWNSIPLEIRECGDLERFQAYIRTEILEKLPCQIHREELLDGTLRRRAKRKEKIMEEVAYYSNLNLQLGNPKRIRPDDFLLHEDFRDDFMKSDLCFKTMRRKNREKIERLKEKAPWMTLCLCDSAQCKKEVEDFEKERNKKLRDFPRVILRDDYVIKTMNNKQLVTPLDDEVKEDYILEDLFEFND